ncbi:heterokaryon incompatibility protein-domain-containing protein [Lophiotrema nucula]|uniref:Heterokaryon incompatibility protein-domain-containing protein n=1 Tax=Lophiotrema nucula TaxID=690887 RepID=A0A6A5Z637_9PLEO|nr:heterokaryon incompatibility protein-domain-containing protein [Lophiotrema nucula]
MEPPENGTLKCLACADLKYEHFTYGGQKYVYAQDDLTGRPKYHFTEYKNVRVAALAGCELCAALCKGASAFWGPQWAADDDVDERNTAAEEAQKDEQDTHESDVREESPEGPERLTGEEEGDRSYRDRFDPNLAWIGLQQLPGRPLQMIRSGSSESAPGSYIFWSMTMRLEFYTEPGTIAVHPAFGESAHVSTNLDMGPCVSTLQTWLRRCDSGHDACKRTGDFTPRRLVFIKGDEDVCLLNTEDQQALTYMTMSHCWGDNKTMIKTTRANSTGRTRKIDWSELPSIYRDSIAITRALGCRYIWIDSLCIVQDDDEDWLDQSGKMADVYSNSFLNIAATACSGSGGTLFADRKLFGGPDEEWEELPPGPARITTEATNVRRRVCVRPSHWSQHGYVEGSVRNHRWDNAPLLDRAWVLQERLLAPRTIHFGISELLYECKTCMECECGGIASFLYEKASEMPNTTTPGNASNDPITPKARFAQSTSANASEEDALILWLELVQQYSSLCITKTSDRPYALLGIAKHMCRATQSNYVAGIWTSDLPRSLLWQGTPTSYTGRKRLGNGIPTWSWMSQYDPKNSDSAVLYVVYARNFQRDHRLQCHLDSPEDTLSWTPTIIGLHITGAVKIGRLQWGPRYEIFDSDWPAQDHHVRSESFPAESRVQLDCPYDDGLKEDMELLFALLGTTQQGDELQWLFLVLAPLNDAGTYMRVGISDSDAKDSDPFHDAEVKSFTVF